MQRRDLNAPDAHLPVAAYTQAIEVSGATRTLYISGQVGQRMDGTIPDDIVEQAAPTWTNPAERQTGGYANRLHGPTHASPLRNFKRLPRSTLSDSG
jgi:hypothetical protein